MHAARYSIDPFVVNFLRATAILSQRNSSKCILSGASEPDPPTPKSVAERRVDYQATYALMVRRGERGINPHANVAYKLQWDQANPEKVRASHQRRRARKLGAPGTHTAKDVVKAWAAWGNRCWMCGGTPTCTDHYIPLSRGGSDSIENLRPACTPCNSRKRDRMPWTL